MNLALTGSETADQLIKQLVYLRGIARRIVMALTESRVEIKESKRLLERLGPGTPEGARAATIVANLGEVELQARTMEIEIGNYLMPLCDALDRTATREQIFEALNINTADRNTEKVREHAAPALDHFKTTGKYPQAHIVRVSRQGGAWTSDPALLDTLVGRVHLAGSSVGLTNDDDGFFSIQDETGRQLLLTLDQVAGHPALDRMSADDRASMDAWSAHLAERKALRVAAKDGQP
ncbi:hypothetical protein [Acidovorax sp.]|uniref:hypothetical protein n=1 Tax=Acidovorax sp. TaxID=1872122 RepID=UPI0025BAE6D5|nr:hypothetical protein [Acidovorax sp.]MBL7089130.1 hypothetical protein [Acidovorax sp.]